MTPTLPSVYPDVPKAGRHKVEPQEKRWSDHWLIDLVAVAVLAFLLFGVGLWSWVTG